MPANEFEKRLRLKMEELKLAPSEEVWLDVERRIRKEKKRRRFIIWFFLFGALTLGGSIMFTKWAINNKNEKSISEESTSSKTNPVSIPLQEPPTNKMPGNGNVSDLTSLKNKTVKYEIAKSIDEVKTSSIDQYENLISETKLPRGVKGSEPGQNNEKEFINDIAKNNLPNKESDKPVIQITNEAQSNNEQITDTSAKKNIASNVQNDKQAHQDLFIVNKDSSGNHQTWLGQPIIESNDSSESRQKEPRVIKSLQDSMAIIAFENKNPAQIKKKKKWKWGLLLQTGRSNIVKGIKFSDKSLYADAVSSPNSSTGGTPQNYYRSPIYSSGSFATGLFFNLPLTKRLEINLGLDYLYLSTQMNIGNKVDSFITFLSNTRFASSNNFYRASAPGTQSNKNRYHFIGLSAELGWKFINNKKFQVYWNNGLSFDRLFSSDALRFDKNLPGYYKDFGSLTHNHIFFSTGLSVPVFKKFEINPLASWSLTHVWRNGETTKTNFTNYGIRIKFFFKKK